MQIDSIIVSSEHIMDTLNGCKYTYIIHIITKKAIKFGYTFSWNNYNKSPETLRVNLKIYICFILPN